jgi:hypothetical protein
MGSDGQLVITSILRPRSRTFSSLRSYSLPSLDACSVFVSYSKYSIQPHQAHPDCNRSQDQRHALSRKNSAPLPKSSPHCRATSLPLSNFTASSWSCRDSDITSVLVQTRNAHQILQPTVAATASTRPMIRAGDSDDLENGHRQLPLLVRLRRW